MARIETYVKDLTLSDKDKVIGSNYINTVNGVDQFKTNNFTLKQLSDYIAPNVATGNLNLKANGGIVEETINNVDKLAVDLGASSITGQLANSNLANSSITINGTAVSLGGSVTTPDTNTQLSTEQVQDIVGAMFSGNTETRIAATYQDSDGTIDLVVDDMTTDANNYVTGASFAGTTTKTITLTRQGLSDITASFTDNDTIYTLPLATSSDRGGVKIGYTENGKNYPVELDNEKMYVNVPWTDTTTVVNDSTANTDFPVVFHNESNGLLDDTGTLTYNPNDAALKVDGLTIDGVSMSGTNIIINSDLLRLGAESSSENYLQGTANGDVSLYYDGSLRFSTTSGGVATSGEIKVRNTSNTVQFVIPDSSGTSGQVLKYPSSGNTLVWANQFVGTDISASTDNDAKGITVTANATSATIGIDVDGLTELTNADFNDDFLVIYDNNVATNKKIHPENIIPGATSSRRGGIKVGYTESGKNYPVELDSEKAYVNVPWTDTVYSLPLAASGTRGGVKIGYSENGKNYPVQLSSEQMYVNVPWTDTNTQLSTEEVQDIIGGMVSGNTETNISVTYDDTNGKLDFSSTDTNTQLSKETVQDYIGEMLSGNTETNITVTYDDSNNKINFASTDTNTQLTDEQVQDIVGAMVSGNTESNVTVTYDDTNGKLDFTASGTQLSKETVQDYVGEMLSSNTETRISVTYDDANNKINFEADDQSYTLPTASSSTLGGVKVGSNLTIDGNGVLDVAAIALTTVQEAANQTAHLALTAQEGDIVVRTDQNKSYVRNSGTAGDMTDYTLLRTPTDAVTSVTTSDSTYIDMTPNSPATGAITVTANLSAVDGSSDTTDRFLTKDNKWAVPAYTTDTNTFRTVQADGAAIGDTETLNLVGGTNVTLTENNGQITIAATDTDTNTFRTVEVDSNGNGSANSTLEASETLRFKKGSNITLSEASGVITISSTDTNTTYDVMGSGNSYAAGLVLAGASSHGGAFLRKDGSWAVPPDTNTDTNTTYDLSVHTGTTKIRLAGSDSTNDDVEIAGGTNVTVTRNNANKLTIASTDTNTQRSDEDIRDVVAAMLTAGTNVSLSEDDANNTLTITSTDTNTDTIDMGDGFTVSADTNTATTTITENDTLTIAGGTNVTTVSNPDGTITINATDTNTTYSTATSSTLGLVKIGYTENGKNYPVELASGKMFVNVPWTDTDTDTNTFRTIEVDGSAIGATETFDLVAGNNITLSESSGEVTIDATDTNTQLTTAQVRSKISGTGLISYNSSSGVISTTATADQTITAGNGLSGGGTGNVTLTNSLISDGKFFTVTANASGGSLSLAQGLGASWNDSGGSGEVDIFFRDGGTNHGTNTLYFHSYNGTDTKQIMKLGGASTSATTYVTMSGTLDVDGRTKLGSSGTANLYLGNIISASSSDKGARFHSSNNDFYFDFQGDSTQHWYLRDYDGSGGIHTRFSFDFINAKFIAGGDVVAFGSPSDKTLKENIKPIDNALDKVEKLQGVTFDWKEQDITNLKEDIGFIAQDVQKVLPELVRENKDGKLSLRHQGIIPVLLEAIKELSDKVKALENGSTK